VNFKDAYGSNASANHCRYLPTRFRLAREQWSCRAQGRSGTCGLPPIDDLRIPRPRRFVSDPGLAVVTSDSAVKPERMILMNSPAKLTDTQFEILSEASQRKDRCLIPPKTMKTAAAQKVTGKLLTAGLVREIKGKAGTEARRRDEETGQAYSLTDRRRAKAMQGSRPERSEPATLPRRRWSTSPERRAEFLSMPAP
jgi:hypothetical protein